MPLSYVVYQNTEYLAAAAFRYSGGVHFTKIAYGVTGMAFMFRGGDGTDKKISMNQFDDSNLSIFLALLAYLCEIILETACTTYHHVAHFL